MGPPVGVLTTMYVPPFDYERGAYASLRTQVGSHSLPHTLSSPARTTLEQSLVSTGNTTHSGCRVLRSGGPNNYKPSVFIVFLHLDRTNPSYPRVHSPSGLRRVHSATRLGLPPDKLHLSLLHSSIECRIYLFTKVKNTSCLKRISTAFLSFCEGNNLKSCRRNRWVSKEFY